MEVQIAVAKMSKYNSGMSGDSLEIIERPHGGLSVVVCDAKKPCGEDRLISASVVRQVLNSIQDGSKDGATCRSISDNLYTEFNGIQEVFLNILSLDLETNTIVISRNNPTPVFVAHGEAIDCLAGMTVPIGGARNIRPSITEIPLVSGTTVVMYTDGVENAGAKSGYLSMDICSSLAAMIEEQDPTAQEIADSLLTQAVRLDNARPEDDMSVVVLRVLPSVEATVRRLVIKYPLHDL